MNKKEAYHVNPLALHLLQQAEQHFSANRQQAFLVGGSVRNLLLKEPGIDWDIVIDSDTPRLARQLAHKLGGFYAHLHNKADRIVVKQDDQEIILDIAHFHGDSIELDLRERDFTINALAIPLASAVRYLASGEPLTLIDPLHGVADLAARRLRAVNDDVFRHDPLRMLRAIRFLARYHLSLETETERMLTRDAPLLPQAAPERIHDELYAILKAEGATSNLRFLDEHGLFTVLFPEFIPARGMAQPDLHHWDVLEHSLESPGALERLAATLQQTPEEVRSSPLNRGGHDDLVTLRSLLYEAQQQNIFRFADLTSPVMKMAALLHDIGKTETYTVADGAIHFYHHPQVGVPLAQRIMKRLSASTRDNRLVQQVVANHMRPGQLSHDPVTERAIRRFFVDLGPTGVYVALISLADHLAMRGPAPLTEGWTRHLATVRLLLARYIRGRSKLLPPRLLQAEELMRRLELEPGPLIGQLLEAIAEAQAEGRITSKDDALWFAEEKLHELQSGN